LCYHGGGDETYQQQNYFCERHTLILRLTDTVSMGHVLAHFAITRSAA
jgi:hypothetical protein